MGVGVGTGGVCMNVGGGGGAWESEKGLMGGGELVLENFNTQG